MRPMRVEGRDKGIRIEIESPEYVAHTLPFLSAVFANESQQEKKSAFPHGVVLSFHANAVAQTINLHMLIPFLSSISKVLNWKRMSGPRNTFPGSSSTPPPRHQLLPVDCIAHVLDWLADLNDSLESVLQPRLVAWVWHQAVVELLERRMSTERELQSHSHRRSKKEEAERWCPPHYGGRKWHRLAFVSAPFMSQEVVRSIKTIDLCRLGEEVSDRTIKELCNGFKHITGLRLWGNAELTAECLSWISQLSQLRSLDISGCLGLGCEALSQLSSSLQLTSLTMSFCGLVVLGDSLQKLTELTALDLSGCEIDERLGSAVARLPHLISLNVAKCAGVTDEDLPEVAKLPELTFLDASCCRVGDAGLVELSKRNTTLECLHLRHCEEITEVGVMSLSQLGTLTALDLTLCTQVTDAAVQALSLGLPQLNTLSLRGCREITEAGVKALFHLEDLTSLDLSGRIPVTEDVLRGLARIPRLATFKVSECLSHITDSSVCMMAQFPALTELDLSICSQLTDNGLQQLSTFRFLEVLNLWGCDRITDVGVKFVATIPTLRALDLSCCWDVSPVLRAEMARRFPTPFDYDALGF